jgi:hypothetical protein
MDVGDLRLARLKNKPLKRRVQHANSRACASSEEASLLVVLFEKIVFSRDSENPAQPVILAG